MDSPREKFVGPFEYILSEETDFKTRKIPIASNWTWNMNEHIDRSFQLKNSKFTTGSNEFNRTRPFKNIIIPIANVNYRTEGFDVKDIEVFVNDSENYHKSLLTRKFHAKWAKKYSIDTAIDESVESYFDYGLTLVKNVNEERPEIIQLQQIAFCDQTDILSGPICLKHQYSIDQLLDMKGKWDSNAIDQAVTLAKFSKDIPAANSQAETPGKYIEVYELHGVFPTTWLKDDTIEYDQGKYTPQLHIVTFFFDKNGEKQGISLFSGKEPKPIFKALKRDNIFGRACGRGGIEELFDAQLWTNYSEIQLKETMDAAALMIFKTTDKKFATQNKISEMRKNQIAILTEGHDISQIQINPQNKVLFDNYINQWEENARGIGAASEPALGINPASGTPLGTTQIVTNQGQGIHEYRRGKIATFWGEIYRDWVLQYLTDEINRGDKWIDELTLDELQEVAERVSINQSNKRIKEIFLSGGLVTKEQQDMMRNEIRSEFTKGGKKRFLEIMKNEFSRIPLDVDFNIAGKQKDLYDVVNKLNGIFRTVFANPAVLQAPGMEDLFNQILELSGLSPVDFTSLIPEKPEEPVKSPLQPNNLEVNTPQ